MARRVLRLTPSLRLDGTNESRPELEVYASAPFYVVSDEPAGRKRHCREVTVGLRPSAGGVYPAHAVLGLELYTYEVNQHGVPCRLRAACRTVDLYKLFAARSGAEFNGNLTNRCVGRGLFKGTVGVTLAGSASATPPARLPRRNAPFRPLERRMVGAVGRSLHDLRTRLRPTLPFLRDVLAPVFRTRTIDLPGAAFWMKPATVAPKCAAHMLAVVLRRHGRTPEDFAAEPDHAVAARVLAEWCSALPSAYPYMEDVYADLGRRVAYESFDDLFARRAGDCEDFSRAMAALFEVARGEQGADWADPALRRLHAIAQKYVPVAVLSTVAAMAYDPLAAWVGGGAERAHMYSRFVPRAVFHRLLGRGEALGGGPAAAVFPGAAEFEPWEAALPTFVGEGTAAVRVDFSRRDRRERRLATACSALPAGFEREARPSFEDGPGGFYRRDVHLLTGHFGALGQSGAGCPSFFSVVDGATGLYGAPFRAWGGGGGGGDGGTALWAHPGFSREDLATMRAVLALEQPSPTLVAPPATNAAAVAREWTTAAGWPAAAADPHKEAEEEEDTAVDFVCSTPDALSARVFGHFVREELQARGAPEVVMETLAAGAPAQLRLRVRSST
jgi:hypothetical protein